MERAGPASAAFEAGLPPPEEADSPAAARSALGSSGTPPPEFPRRISFEAKMATMTLQQQTMASRESVGIQA